MRYSYLGLLLLLNACIGVPEGIKPVDDFNIDAYLGKWYEIARFDHSFERGLEQVTAEYSLRDGGGITVLNRGFNPQTGQWKQAKGKAFFVGDNKLAHLKVSFFGPLYGSYIVFELGDDDQYAFVTSYDKSYLWLLSREPMIDEELKSHFINTIKSLGFDSSQLIFVEQNTPGADPALSQ